MKNDPPRQPNAAHRKLLTCDHCDYSLDGLVIESGSVTCPECSCEQTLMVWTESLQSRLDKEDRVLWICVTVFLLVVSFMFIAFFIGAAIFSGM
tara:strand:+ start:10307 stop:10588 length:282 start_codon:yes stop_codon:yes gene_type:complete